MNKNYGEKQYGSASNSAIWYLMSGILKSIPSTLSPNSFSSLHINFVKYYSFVTNFQSRSKFKVLQQVITIHNYFSFHTTFKLFKSPYINPTKHIPMTLLQQGSIYIIYHHHNSRTRGHNISQSSHHSLFEHIVWLAENGTLIWSTAAFANGFPFVFY